MRKPKQQFASLDRVLEYFEGPQAVLLQRSADSRVVAVAIDHEGFQSPFFGAEISRDQWERYRRGFVDLRYLFVLPKWKTWFLFDLGKMDEGGRVELIPTAKTSLAEQDYIPEAGFFARDHSEPLEADDASHLTTQSYKIDGAWDLGDFSQFYGKVTDLYSFFLALKKYVAPNTDVDLKKRVKDAFFGHPLRGGSSYVNLYGDLWSVQEIKDRISVRRIQYASPGNVDVNGRADIFIEMQIAMAEFAIGYEGLRQAYNKLHKYLASSQLLRADPERFDRDGSVAKYLLQEARALAALIRLTDVELIYKLTDNNSLALSKIVLSHFRRLEKYYLFFAEGRVQE